MFDVEKCGLFSTCFSN